MSQQLKREFWFVIGSQHLYGEEALAQVKANAEKMTDALNNSGVLPYPIVLQDLAVSAEKITKHHERSELPRRSSRRDHLDAYFLAGQDVDPRNADSAEAAAAPGYAVQ